MSRETLILFKNESGEERSFGLTQSAQAGPEQLLNAQINALVLLSNDTKYFLPTEKVRVFLSSSSGNGKVSIPSCEIKIFKIDFSVDK